MPSDSVIKILAVDDETDVCALTKEFLSLKGQIEVSTASSVKEARSLLVKDDFDIILSDYSMPQENGLQFLRSLRTAGNAIPFVLFTCREREEVVIDALNFGADAYIHKGGKPVPLYVELEHSIREAVMKSRREQELRDSESRFRELADLLPAAVFEMDLIGNLTFLNQYALGLFGFTEHDFSHGIAALQLLAPEERERGLRNIETSLQSKGPLKEEYTAIRKDGGLFFANFVSAAIVRQGKVVGLRGLINDITEERRSEESQRIQKFRVQREAD
jgi:PAS domain S-box-containing protein